MKTYQPPEGIKFDLVLFDASHVYDDSVKTFTNIETYLSPKVLILVHDTGNWREKDLPPDWSSFKLGREIILKNERDFIRFLRTQGYSDVSFESSEHLRHGYTILKKLDW
jgi:hypothetical protein